MKKPKTITLKNSRYQPSKAEQEKVTKLDVPGKDIHEKARNLASAILQPVKIRYEND